MALDKVHLYVRSMSMLRERVNAAAFSAYPFNIPAIRSLDTFEFHPKVTYFVGENACGKSTLVEAIAVGVGFNAEGGSKNFQFATRSSESSLHQVLRFVRGIHPPRTGFFLRAESFFNVATEIERLDKDGFGPPIIGGYGGVYQHNQSHGESFRALLEHRFRPNGLYILDEPESALSPRRQLALVGRIHALATHGHSQFIIATHSPIVLAYPDAQIYELSDAGITPRAYEQTDTVRFTQAFLRDRETLMNDLIAD